MSYSKWTMNKESRIEQLSLLWAHQDLNLGPTDYESVALTN